MVAESKPTVEHRPASFKAEIRATNPYNYRPGEWAEVGAVVHLGGRPCWFVNFDDGETDFWVVDDPADQYEFRLVPRAED